MSFEARWYSDFSRNGGNPPAQKRLDLAEDRSIIIVLMAADYAVGIGGHRPVYGHKGEQS